MVPLRNQHTWITAEKFQSPLQGLNIMTVALSLKAEHEDGRGAGKETP